MPCSISALVIAPVPGPSSTTGPADSMSTYCAMVRANTRPDGITAPMCSGFSIHERRKRTSSSRRRGFFNARADDCRGMLRPDGGRALPRECQKRVINTYRSQATRSSRTMPRGDATIRPLLSVFFAAAHKRPCVGAGLLARATAEEILNLGEEARRFGLRRTGGQFLELGEQFLLLPGQVLRRLDHDLDIHVSGLARAQHRHPLRCNAETTRRLSSRGDFDLGLALVDGRHFEFAAQGRGDHRDRYATMQIGAVALEELMRAQRQENVEIARGAATEAGLAFAGQPDPRPIFHALRDVDRQGPLARHPSRPGA